MICVLLNVAFITLETKFWGKIATSPIFTIFIIVFIYLVRKILICQVLDLGAENMGDHI